MTSMVIKEEATEVSKVLLPVNPLLPIKPNPAFCEGEAKKEIPLFPPVGVSVKDNGLPTSKVLFALALAFAPFIRIFY